MIPRATDVMYELYRCLPTSITCVKLLSWGDALICAKETDYKTHSRCSGGIGILPEEVWVNGKGAVVRYDLAFLSPLLSMADKGRVLGFDNAHGTHECHSMGEVHPSQFRGYLATAKRFYREAEAIKRNYENESISRRL